MRTYPTSKALADLGLEPTPQDSWEYDRQQNIIDSIDAASKGQSESADLTLLRRRQLAVNVQKSILRRLGQDNAANDAVNQADAQWRAANPPPLSEDDQQAAIDRARATKELLDDGQTD